METRSASPNVARTLKPQERSASSPIVGRRRAGPDQGERVPSVSLPGGRGRCALPRASLPAVPLFLIFGHNLTHRIARHRRAIERRRRRQRSQDVCCAGRLGLQRSQPCLASTSSVSDIFTRLRKPVRSQMSMSSGLRVRGQTGCSPPRRSSGCGGDIGRFQRPIVVDPVIARRIGRAIRWLRKRLNIESRLFPCSW